MRDVRKDWERYSKLPLHEGDARKHFRLDRQFDKDDPMVEQMRWRYDLSRLFQETIRLQQDGSNQPSVISEEERASIEWFYNLETTFGMMFSRKELSQSYESPEEFIKAREEAFEQYLYGYLINEATRNVEMRPYSEELPFRKGEIAIRQMAVRHGYDVYKYKSATKHIDPIENRTTWEFDRTCFYETTVFALIPPVPDPKHVIYIVHDSQSDDSTRWEVHVVPVEDQHVLKEQLKEYVCHGQWSINVLKPVKREPDGSIPF